VVEAKCLTLHVCQGKEGHRLKTRVGISTLRLLQAQRLKETGRRCVGGCSCHWGQEHPSMGFSKASPHTFSKPPDPKFAREVSVATPRVYGFTRPECPWTKAVFRMPVLLPLIAEIYLGIISKSLKKTPSRLPARKVQESHFWLQL